MLTLHVEAENFPELIAKAAKALGAKPVAVEAPAPASQPEAAPNRNAIPQAPEPAPEPPAAPQSGVMSVEAFRDELRALSTDAMIPKIVDALGKIGAKTYRDVPESDRAGFLAALKAPA